MKVFAIKAREDPVWKFAVLTVDGEEGLFRTKQTATLFCRYMMAEHTRLKRQQKKREIKLRRGTQHADPA